MADAVQTNVIFNGDSKLVLQLLNASDGTGEALVAKVASASYTGPNAPQVTGYFTIEEIKWDVQGFTNVDLYFDETTNIPAAKMSGYGYVNYKEAGGLTDPVNAGSTGNILLSTAGAFAGATYDITLVLRKKN